RELYDFVLVDTPPLLAVTDPCVVGPRVDGVILTIRLSKNSGPQAVRAREILATLGVKVIGVVVNGGGRNGSSRGYHSGAHEYVYGPTNYGYHSEQNGEGYYQDAEVNGACDATGVGPEGTDDQEKPPAPPGNGKPARKLQGHSLG